MFYTFKNLIDKKEIWPQTGKKAESLIQLISHGFPVPSGAVITTNAFRTFAIDNGFNYLVDEIVSSSSDTTDKIVELRNNIYEGILPERLREDIQQYYHNKQPETRFAVRSSGTKEDLADASFAGQYKTLLNVRTIDEVYKAIKECWVSAYSDNVMTYINDKQIGSTNLELAVIIQEMVTAEKSGILFTVNPVKGIDREMVIEACFGLGESIVGGSVNPDQYYYNWYEKIEVERIIGHKSKSTVAKKDQQGTIEIDNSLEKQTLPVLDKKEVERIASLGLRIQEIFGFPIDIEWACENNNFYILQSRPITSISFTAIEGEWTTADFKDGGVSSSVCTPLMWSLYDFVFKSTMTEYLKKIKLLNKRKQVVWTKMFFCRPYWNLSEVKKALIELPGFIEKNFDTDLGIEITYNGDGASSKTTPKSILKGLKVYFSLKKSFKKQMEYCPGFKAKQIESLKSLEGFDPYSLNRDDFFAFYKKFIKDDYFRSESSYFYLIYDNSNLQTLFKNAYKKLNTKADLLTLLSGLKDLSHLRPNYRLWDISRKIKADEHARAFWSHTSVPDVIELLGRDSKKHYLDELKAFIQEFKYHSTRELDLMVPRFGEAPTFVIERCKELINLDQSFDPYSLNDKQHKNYLKERTLFLKTIPWYKSRRLGRLLEQVRSFLWWREELRDLSSNFYFYVRKFTLILADHLCKNNVLEQADDIFFLPIDSILSFLEGDIDKITLQTIIKRNRSYYRSFSHFKNPDEIGQRFQQMPNIPDKQKEGNIFRGIACSPGIISGKARVIEDIFDAHRIEKGDILITNCTDPAWTPIFGIISGVATETGGLLSHAAVISREYGIPSVLAIKNLTQYIRDGDTITIYGSKGYLVKEE